MFRVAKVSTAAQAAGIVADSKFPPDGRRGFGSPFAGPNFGMSSYGYATHANKFVLVMVQIETKEGTENAQAIAETPGIGKRRSMEPSEYRKCVG